MLSSLVFDSLQLWPLAAAMGLLLTLAVMWLYPAQIRGPGVVRWLPPLLRWLAIVALTASLLKPVVLRPKTVDQWGAVLMLIDCSKSMGVTDSARTPAERVALAGALGRLTPGKRSGVAESLAGDLDLLQSQILLLSNARSDLDYARLSGRGVAEKQAWLHQTLADCDRAARVLGARAVSLPEGSALRQRLTELGPVNTNDDREAAIDDLKRRVDRAKSAMRGFQAAADESLYKSDPTVRAACDAVARLSRIDLTREALFRTDTELFARLGGKVPIVGMEIGPGLYPVSLTYGGQPTTAPALSARGNESDLAGAVTAAIGGVAGRPVRAIVLWSDGRQVSGRGDLASALRPSGVPVYTVGVAPETVPDVSISGVSLSARSAFAGETLEGDVRVTEDAVSKPPTELHIATSSGEQVERLIPHPRQDRQGHGREWVAHFSAVMNPPHDSPAERLVFSVPPTTGETTASNNRVERWIKVSPDKLRVALCTAAPGWDYQYLRGALSRRPWLQMQSYVLDPEHPQLDMTAQQILQQDVLVLDDLPVEALNVNQWDAVHSLVALRGGSVILVAGNTYSIADYTQQPIARTLLPFHDVRPSWKQWPGEQPAFRFVPTPMGAQEALRLGDGPDAGQRRWQDFPGVYRYLQIPDQSLFPDVRRLLLEADSGGTVLTERRIGAGRVFLLGVNETWRWRFKSGEREADQFWRQIVHHAAGEPYAANSGPLSLDADVVAASPGQPIHLRARVHGEKSPSDNAASCTVQVVQDGKVISTRQLRAIGGGHFTGQIADLTEGEYELQLAGVAVDGAAVVVRVPLHIAQDDEAEMRDVSGDIPMLSRIARSTGGQYLSIEQVNELPDRLNALNNSESQFTRRPLWNSPFLFGFVLACFAGEWSLRKRFGLA